MEVLKFVSLKIDVFLAVMFGEGNQYNIQGGGVGKNKIGIITYIHPCC